MRIFISFLLMLGSVVASAAEKPYTLAVHNPGRDIGYIVGDTIKRSIDIEVRAPYLLAPGSIPAKGVTYKGIELREVQLSEKKSSDARHYQLSLMYQVFTSSPNVKKLDLPKVVLQVTNAGKHLNVNVPAWQFRISPLATHNETYVEQDMSPYRGPMLLDAGHLKPLFGGFLALTFISVLGLIYINADAGWFPGMGGPFAASHRRISSLPDNEERTRRAVDSIHLAFNQTYGENLFEADIDTFLQKHPSFSGIRKEIRTFFDLSNAVLYGLKANEAKADESLADSLRFLSDFCKLCRNCERGVA
jgi:hypothetical protein